MKKEDKRLLKHRAERVGKRFVNNQGAWFTITTYHRAINIDITFDCGYKVFNVTYDNIKKGDVINPYHPTIFGKGYNGVGLYRCKVNGIDSREYVKWYKMFERCYCPKALMKKPTYIDCEVDERWYNFQVFGKWFEENYKEGFELDKDILFKGNKLYSPETCCFVPQEINALFTKSNKARGDYPIGVSYHKRDKKFQGRGYANKSKYFTCPFKAFNYYKQEKEDYIKLMADKWQPWIMSCGFVLLPKIQD